MPSKYDRREASTQALAKKHRRRGPAPTLDAQNRYLMRLLRKRWPKKTKAHREIRDALLDVQRDGLHYRDLEVIAAADLAALDDEYAAGQVPPDKYFALRAKLLDCTRRLMDSRRASDLDSAPGAIRIIFEQAPDMLDRICARLEATGAEDAARDIRELYEGGGIIDVDLMDDLGDDLDVE